MLTCYAQYCKPTILSCRPLGIPTQASNFLLGSRWDNSTLLILVLLPFVFQVLVRPTWRLWLRLISISLSFTLCEYRLFQLIQCYDCQHYDVFVFGRHQHCLAICRLQLTSWNEKKCWWFACAPDLTPWPPTKNFCASGVRTGSPIAARHHRIWLTWVHHITISRKIHGSPPGAHPNPIYHNMALALVYTL